MDSNTIYKKVENHVVGLFEKNHNPKLLYHNLQHTRNVVNKTKQIAAHYELSERDMLIVYVAAWFHDTGYIFTEPQWHEEKSSELMRRFMTEYHQEEELINEVVKTILATKPTAKPETLLQEILRDADSFHFGTKDFKEMNKLVMAEHLAVDPEFDQFQAQVKTLQMLESHRFFTSYCRNQLNDGKNKNVARLKKKLEKQKTSEAASAESKQNVGLINKGIQTMLRLTSENHMKLSDMADQKANILISVNAIIISVILSVLLRKLQTDAYLTIPTIIFLLVAVTTIVISILATRPKISSGKFEDQDVIDKKTNLLFFGNFHDASFEQYEPAMLKMMKDTDYLYGSLIKDIYQLGVVLGRKYRLVRLAYNIFMIGIIISVIAFAIATFFYQPETVIINNAPGTPL
ncbi:HD domain-containing protein [Segetibacter sp. 3557_3]|uniref:Pycsar system effector family protein n=1 Tax=Segetibacter sp. 3557_3 TaxID=2547429 RepID=UPI00105877A3|nr:Pycsar system effector family protein [Segetibacter sp. 3557_3]TDH25101.1 HD domain-containing protein [Segetibacter sp. 3557_3]